MFGFGAGPITRDDTGGRSTPRCTSVTASSGCTGAAGVPAAQPGDLRHGSHCMAVDVDDVDAHHARTRAAGAEIAYAPTEMPYGVREYGVRDHEGGLWSFMQPMSRRGGER